MRDDGDVWHLNGVRSGNADVPTPLPDSIGLERNVLGVPIFVLNSKTAVAQSELVYEWRTREGRDAKFKFIRAPSVPFPQSQHVVYFDALLAMFTNNFREDGYLYFRISDVLRYVGKSRTSGSYDAVKETIYRYAHCTAHWYESWTTPTGQPKCENWHGTLIEVDDIWDEKRREELKLRLNPRNAQKANGAWHRIRFHRNIVESVKNGFTKIFLTKVLNLGVKHDALCVYRYFFGFSDSSEIRRHVSRLMTAFAWQGGRKDRFETWLTNQLNELVSYGLVDTFTIKSDLVTVKCMPIKDLRDNLLPKVTSKPNQKATRTKKPKSIKPQIADDALLQHYFDLKASGKVLEHVAETIDLCLAKGSRDLYLPAIRNYLERAEN